MSLFFEPALCVINSKAFSIEQYSNAMLRVPSEVANKLSVTEDDDIRIRRLLHKLSHKIQALEISAPVCVLLPKISCKPTLKSVTSVILSAFHFKSDSQIRFYPYGEASFLMALSQIQKLSFENRFTWIVAINLGESLGSGMGAYDSLVAARCVVVNEGIEVRAQSIDLDITSLNTAVDNVIRQLGSTLKHPVDELLLSTGNGQPKWLESIRFLSPVIKAETQYTFSDVLTGPLGPCGGLLKTLSLCYQQQVRRVENFHALQLDIEEDGYAVGTSFNWCSE
ncbi:NAD/NADP transhydrogenase beta subunit [Vibrio hyugaensis]|uniref:NAD/NADP transhydrogenase beta subunit n=1 Tax=Vibrio hyugaensis TaxID=1534743 RepID=UPI000CE3D16C|nr:NAD/NADP transhydrogenase beta subunit [Vibrio hyugaensis]